MAISSPKVEPRLGKSTLSTFFRTGCDKELYLSLFKSVSATALEKAGVPPALSARPNIELVRSDGVAFETAELDELRAIITPARVISKKAAAPKDDYEQIDLKAELTKGPPVPSFLVQPSLNPQPFRQALLLQDFGLTAQEEALIPDLTELRPDLFLLRSREDLEWEVHPSGRRLRLLSEDIRTAISVIDIKNSFEGNRSYAAEVVLYSIFLAKWLQHNGFSDRYFVSDQCFLWTTREKVALKALPTTAPIADKIAALLSALDHVALPVIAPSVVKFFKQDLPRIIELAKTRSWQHLEYHVGPKCSNCDYLGFERWLSGDDKLLLQAHRDWYCQPVAAATGHLSRIPNMSRGARMMLEKLGVADLAGLSVLPSSSPALSRHGLLKRERSQLGPRAHAIITDTGTLDKAMVLSGLAGHLDLQLAVAVNFDSAANLLTGIALRSSRAPSTLSTTRDFSVSVDDQTPDSEWNALFAFLSMLEQDVAQATTALGDAPRTQIIFWERRQFEELCAAVGRHFHRIMAIRAPRGGRGGRSLIPALSLLFPPDEILERDAEISPHIVFLNSQAQMALRYPISHAFTLRSVHEAYHLPSLKPRYLDNYFIDPLGNGIPRERIYEVWKNSGTIKRGATLITKTQAAADYQAALKHHTQAIASIAAQLRLDYVDKLKGLAPRLSPMDFGGANKVAFDSKLWIQWEKISDSTSSVERKIEYTLTCERLEASYKALRLTNLIRRLGAARATYKVSADSAEAKLDDDGAYFVVGDALMPGLPLQTPALLGLPMRPHYGSTFRMPLWSLVRGKIWRLDRVKLEADIELIAKSTEAQSVVADLIAAGLLPLARGELFLMDGTPPQYHETTTKILREVGCPAYATADPSTAGALGIAPPPAPRQVSPDTPLGRVLWDAANLATRKIRTAADGLALADRASKLTPDGLDDSQRVAIAGLSQQQLALVWGPPGTGKTTTLVGYLQALIEQSLSKKAATKILISGPNYRAVEVLIHQLVESLNLQPSQPCSVYMVYSRSRTPVPFKTAPKGHLNAGPMSLGSDAQVASMRHAYTGKSVAVFGISAHTVPNLTEALGRPETLPDMFDLLIIDESSQVPLNLALNPLSAIKSTCQVVIAGDWKQMPPIESLPPPLGAEHMVGSIHKYLLHRFSIPEQKLLRNYRSADHLVDYAKTLGYDPGLLAVVPSRRLQFIFDPAAMPLPAGLPNSPLWAAVLEPEKVVTTILHDDPSSSQASHAEASMVTSLAYLLRKCAHRELAPLAGPAEEFISDDEFFSLGLGVVTPHKAQRALVIAELMKQFPGVSRAVMETCVDTVERFQGGQRHTIIVSFGVGDVDLIEGEEAFLLQMERANVAISRAMAKCIVIMPKSLAYHLPAEAKVAETAVALKSYVEEFCQSRQTLPIQRLPDAELRWHR